MEAERPRSAETSRKAEPALWASAIAFAVGIPFILAFARVYNDDPFITFRYAWNLAHGNGFVYNAGERVAGTTAPLYALALAGLFALGAPLGFAVAPLTALGYALIGWASWRLLSRAGLPWGGAALGILLLVEPELFLLYGHETPLLLGAVLAAFALYDSGRYRSAFIAAALAAGVRPDAALVGVVLITLSLQERPPRLWPGLAWGAAVFLPLYAAFVLYYQAPAPNTLAAKMDQGARNYAPFWKGVMHGSFNTLLGPDLFPCGALAILGAALMARRRWLAIPFYLALYTVAYCFMNPPYIYQWYHAPYWALRACAIGWGIGWLGELKLAHRPAWNRLGRHAAAALLIIAAASLTVWRRRDPNHYLYGRWTVWRAAAERIKSLDAADRRIVLNEIGIVGWELRDWQVIDLERLVHRAPLEELLCDPPPRYLALSGPLPSSALRAGGRTYTYRLVQGFNAPDYNVALFELADEPVEKRQARLP